MSRGIIDITGTDSNGNAGMTVRVTDDNGVMLENINITGESSENKWTEVAIQGTPNQSESLTAYKSGRTCILKAINLTTRVGYQGGNNDGWYCMANFDSLGKYKNMFLPSTNIFWYNEITLLQSLTFKMSKKDDNGSYTTADQVINNPYHMSFGLKPNGELYNRLERRLTSNSLVEGVNFTLVYLV